MVRRARRYWFWLAAALLLAACDRLGEAPRAANELRVGLLDDPVFYQPAPADGEPAGFEYDLLVAYAAARGKSLRVFAAADPARLLAMLERREVDFVAGAPVRAGDALRFSTVLRSAKPLIVQHADTLPVDDLEELNGRSVETLAGTAEEAALLALNLPALQVLRPPVAGGIELLARVAARQADLAATDSAHLDIASNFYPDLNIAQELPGKVDYAWAFRAEDAPALADADAFLAGFRADGRLARLADRYFGHVKRIKAIGALQFSQDMRTRLPHYRRLFQEAQRLTGLDWRLLAALAYQESKWDPLATSYTNVRGMMMLTEDTADHLGVSNRLDPRQSVLAGARYLAELMERLPAEVAQPDRLWLALAAYNLGMGHLNGARHLATGLKRDPNVWFDMKQVLPLLARPEYYERLKSGRGRGGEAVIMVENIRTYYDILARFEPAGTSPFQSGLAMQ